MKRIVLALLVLSGSSIFAADLFDTARLTMESFGPVKIGMTLDDVKRITGMELDIDEDAASESCFMAGLTKDPGIQFMIEDGKVSRIEILDAHHQTLSGIRIGDTETRAQRVYGGKLEVQPHKYDDDGHYLILRSRDNKSALVLATDGKHINEIRGGLVPFVEYVEHCL